MTGDWAEALGEAELDGGQVVICAGEGETFPGKRGICHRKEVENCGGSDGHLMVQAGELVGNNDHMDGLPG